VLENWQVAPDPQVFVQHWTSVGSFGQIFGWDVPPEDTQEFVGIQMPGVPSTVQGPFNAANAKVVARSKTAARIILEGLKKVRTKRDFYSLAAVIG